MSPRALPNHGSVCPCVPHSVAGRAQNLIDPRVPDNLASGIDLALMWMVGCPPTSSVMESRVASPDVRFRRGPHRTPPVAIGKERANASVSGSSKVFAMFLIVAAEAKLLSFCRSRWSGGRGRIHRETPCPEADGAIMALGPPAGVQSGPRRAVGHPISV
jgi:hypothetical protein